MSTLNIILEVAKHELDERLLEVLPAGGDEDEALGADLHPSLHRRVEVVVVLLVRLPPRPPGAGLSCLDALLFLGIPDIFDIIWY